MLKEVIGDYSNPIGGGHRIIIDLVNAFSPFIENEKGITQYKPTSLSKRYPKCASSFNIWARNVKQYISGPKFELGEFNFVEVQSDTTVLQLLTTEDDENKLRQAFEKIASKALETKSSIHFSKGDTYKKHLQFIDEFFIKRGLSVYLYKYEEKK